MNRGRKTFIAVIDDDESICLSMSRLLRAAGFQPVSYPSAEAFLADQNPSRFDCLVLDIQLQGMSGVELHQRLSAADSSTPVIFITAHDDPDVRAQAETGGCAGFFRKTDSGADILAAIRDAVAHAHTGKQPLTKGA